MPVFQTITVDIDAPLGLITLNRPEKHNAISLKTLEELHQAVDQLAEDEDVRVISFWGAGGKAFASGSDLTEVADRDLKKGMEPIVQGLAAKLEGLPKVTIAAIDGICMGGGLEIALGCDLRICTPKSRFATPEGKLGIIPGGGATARLPRLIGKSWALEMLLMGEAMDAAQALQMGLVTRVTEPDQLKQAVRKMALHLAGYAPFVPHFMKIMVQQGLEGSSAAALAMEKFAQSAL
ncbi:MAG: enoyl-CoA hydratase/isomerase family protein, partial [Pseudomonadales bacterium]|nr:enoyl-CoA hydratase/isomerase family protein [Pseudomonadales bacterium]